MGPLIAIAEQAARAGGRVLREMIGRVKVYEKGPKDLVTEADRISQSVVRNILLNAFPDHQFLGEEDDLPAGYNSARTCHESPTGMLRWIVDPLDGTTNFVHGLPGFAVSIGVERDGEVLAGVVFDPTTDECFIAERGQGAYLNGERLRVSRCRELREAMVAASFPANVPRSSPEIANFGEILVASQSLRRLGSAALNLSYLAAGRIDAYWATSVKPWDVAAGVLLLLEAGGVITALNGFPFQLAQPKFAAAATQELHGELLRTLGSTQHE